MFFLHLLCMIEAFFLFFQCFSLPFLSCTNTIWFGFDFFWVLCLYFVFLSLLQRVHCDIFDFWVLLVQKIEFFCVPQPYLIVVEYCSSFARQKLWFLSSNSMNTGSCACFLCQSLNFLVFLSLLWCCFLLVFLHFGFRSVALAWNVKEKKQHHIFL